MGNKFLKTKIVLVVAMAMCVGATQLRAQVTTAGIFGSVSDRTGAMVPAADITVVNTDTNLIRTTKTDAHGQYSVRALPVGTYQVEASAPGFKKAIQSGVVLDLNRNARVDMSVDIGPVAETIAVTGDAPMVNVADASIGRTVDNHEIVRLPLVNREVYALLNLTPGVEMNTTGNTVGFRQTTVSINGSGDGGAGSVSYYLDGGSNMTGLRNTGNATPNPDAVQEFRVITNGYSAEFGRFPAGVIDVVTKSGSNSYHGTLFEFLRNDALDANTWGALSKPPLRRNQFGGTMGGPVKRDKLFFFGSYSGLRQRSQDFNSGAVVPTDLERAGNFSQSSKKAAGANITNGIISPNALDPVAMKIIKDYVPAANLPGQVYQYTSPRPTDGDDFNFKIDYQTTPSHLDTLSYFDAKFNDTPSPGGNMPWSTQKYTSKQQNANLGDTWTISATTVNQFRMTYVRNFGGRLNLPGIGLEDLGSKFTTVGPKSLPAINVSGFMNFSNAIQGPIAGSNYYGLREAVSMLKGRHTLKFGADASLEKIIQDTSLNNYSVWTFDGKKTGNALADFMLGLPASFKQDMPVTKIDNGWFTGMFIQDDYRIHPRLILNLGLRYELPTPMTDPHDRKMGFAPGVQSQVAPKAPIGLVFPGDPGVGRGIIPMPKRNFAPRVGLAWDPLGDGKSSIRAGAGIFYGSISSNNMNNTADFQPFAARQTFPTVKTLADPFGNTPGGNPFPIVYDPSNPKFITPADVSTLALNYRFPYTYQLNFSVQRQITSDLSVTSAYVGSLAHRLPFTVDKNYPVYTATATTANINTRRPFLPGILGIVNFEDGIINASYHGWQTTVEKRISRGYMVRGYYVFSKSLEGAQSQNNQPTGGAEDFRNLALERGRTNNDRRHSFVMSAIWEINYFNGANPYLKHLLNNWSIAAIARLRSGTPFTVTTGQDTNVDGNNNDRANLIGSPNLDANRSRADVVKAWFDTAAFGKPAAGANGNAARNLLDNPGQKLVDLSLAREFKIRESLGLEFRAEMTNAFNLVNLNGPNGNMNSNLFGTITTAGEMRKMQLGLRLAF
jgi:hypothetical protein